MLNFHYLQILQFNLFDSLWTLNNQVAPCNDYWTKKCGMFITVYYHFYLAIISNPITSNTMIGLEMIGLEVIGLEVIGLEMIGLEVIGSRL